MKLLRPVRGIYSIKLRGWELSEYGMAILDRMHVGRYRWPMRADNDRDHIKW